MRTLYSLLLACCVSTLSYGSHLLGGEITWECLANGKYIFTMTLYKECGQGAIGLQTSYTISGPVSIPVTQQQVKEISPVCLGGGSISCGTSPSGEGAVERYTYKSGQINLPKGPPPASGWMFTWTECCRPTTVRNGPTGSYYLRAIMYPYTPIGASTAQDEDPCFDSSPYFSELGALTICSGSEFTYNHLAADKDLDSLYIRFADPWESLNGPVSFLSGYSSTSPYPSNLSHPTSANGPIVLDNKTGAISMNIHTATAGSYPSCYAIEAWKCGQTASGPAPIKVAEVFRDVAIVVRNGCNPNNEPSVLIDTATYPDITQVNDKSYFINVYPGDTIDFQLNAKDFDFLPNGLPQSITFNASGLQASSPMPSGTGCVGVAPCAQFTPVAPQPGFTSPLNNNVRFFWVPTCQHLGAYGFTTGGNFCNPVSSFFFSLRMQDDGCPAPEIALTTFVVNVVIGDPTPINFGCLTPLSNGNVRLGWERSHQDSALEFNYYMILAAAPGGTYDTISRIYDIDSTSLSFSNTNGYTSFYMLKSTGDCDFLSRPSDTLQIMNMSLTATPPGSAEYAQLSWTPLRTPLSWTTRGVYEIWTEAPAGSGNWVKVGETTALSFTDTVTVCNSLANYQIRVTDTIAGCQSGSNTDSARFSDQTNSDKMVLDSVSVNQNGHAIISWEPTKYGDVIAYLIYYNHSKLGWIVVDTVWRGAPLPYEWADSKADSRSELFKVVSIDSCGNQSDDQVVRAHATIHLRGYLNKCEGYSRVSWNQYEGFGKEAIAGYRLYVQTTDPSGTTTPFRLLYAASPEDTSYLQTNLRNAYQYCYYVKAVDTSGAYTSTSNYVCVDAEVPRKSKILYLAQATYEPDANSINLSTFVDGQADVQKFSVERAPDIEGPYKLLGVVGKPNTKPYLINFSDYGADANSYRYYYRVSATDSCGERDTVSNFARNILLEVEPRANLTNLLTWNEYTAWAGNVKSYSVYRRASDEVRHYKVAEVAGRDTFFVDNITDYGNTDGGFCYYVLAQEGPNSLNILGPDGLPYTSRSNDVCINQWARMYMPTAFRPGSDIGVNRQFGPTLKFEDIDQYTFYIMNRWGVKVFETNDPSVKWDGQHQGENAPPGVYVYFLKYSTPGDKAREQRGTFTLIR